MSEPRLMRRDFVLLWQGLLVSQLGNQAFMIAVMLWMTRETGSQALLGALLAAVTLPGVLLAPLAGSLADHYDRKTLIVGSDLIRGLLITVLAVLYMVRPGEVSILVAALFVVAVLSGSIGALFSPALYAAVPDLVPEQRLQAANSLIQLSSRASTALGQAIGGIAYAALGAPLLFLVDGLSYLFSGVSEALIRIPVRERTSAATGLRSRLREIAAGLEYVRSRTGMGSFLFLTAGINFLFTPTVGLLPFYVRGDLHAGPEWVGFLLAAVSLGGIAGSIGAAAVPARGPSRSWAVSALFVGASLCLAALGLVGRPLAALALVALLGVFSGALNVSVMTQMQASTPTEVRGRVMGVVIAAVGIANPVGLGATGLLSQATGADAGTVFAIAGALSALLVVWGLRDRDRRDFLAGGPSPDSLPGQCGGEQARKAR